MIQSGITKAEFIKQISDMDSDVLHNHLLCEEVIVKEETPSGIIAPESFTKLDATTGLTKSVICPAGMIRFAKVIKCGHATSPNIKVGDIVEIRPLEPKTIKSDLDGKLIIDEMFIVRTWHVNP